VTEVRISGLRGRTPFVGRSAEMRWLDRDLKIARDGEPRAVFVVGEAGIGKSRLLSEFCGRAADSGMRVLRASGEEDLVLPYRLLSEAIAPLLTQRGPRPSVDEEWARSLLSELAPSAGAPEIADALARREGADPARWRAFHALETGLVSLAREQPVLLALDDLHWADGPSLELLRRLVHASTEAARTQPVPLFFLGAARPLEKDAVRARLLDRLQREAQVTRLELSGLALDSVAEVIGAAGLAVPSPRLAATLHALTRGNPLFLESVCRHLRQHDFDPSSQLDDLPLPSSISETIDTHLARLSHEAREVLAYAACLGDQFSLDDLIVITDQPRAAVLDRLEEGCAEGILVAEHGFAFAHPLLRHGLYREGGELGRQRMSLRAADRLGRAHGGDSGPRALEIAQHLIRAGPIADRARLARVTREAGDRAMAAWAPAEAARFYEAALEAAPDATPPGELGKLHFLAGVASYREADAHRAREHFERAAAQFESAADRAGVARALLEHTRADITLDPLPYGTMAEIEALEKALGELPERELRLRGQIHSVLSGVHWTARQPEPALHEAREAIRVAREIRDRQLESEAYAALNVAQTQTLDLEAAVASGEASVAAARSVKDAWLEGTARSRLPLLHLCLGDLERAEAAADEAEACVRRTQDWSDLSLVVGARVTVLAARGSYVQARELAAELERLAVLSGYPWGAFGGLRALAGAAYERGEIEEAEEALSLLERPGVIFRQPGATRLATWIDRQRMRAERAPTPELRKTLVSVLGGDVSEVPPEIGAVSSFCAIVEIARSLGEPELAARPARALEAAYQRGVRISSGWVHALARVLGVAAWLEGEAERAEQWFREAEDFTTASGAVVELARTYLDHAHLLDERGARSDARRLAARARAHFSELGIPELERSAAALADGRELSKPAGPPLPRQDTDDWKTIPWSRAENPMAVSRRLQEFLASLDAATTDTRSLEAVGALERVILMTDMAGSTDRLVRLGARAALEVTRQHDAILRACLAKFGGEEKQHTGDGIFACFEAVDSAIACAARMQRELEERNEEASEAILIRIGVAAGPVTPIEERLFGSAVILAARLCAEAEPSQIVVSPAVRGLAESAGFSFRDLDERILKGFPDRVRLHEVVW
jgi:class 3 adenylate cyclase